MSVVAGGFRLGRGVRAEGLGGKPILEINDRRLLDVTDIGHLIDHAAHIPIPGRMVRDHAVTNDRPAELRGLHLEVVETLAVALCVELLPKCVVRFGLIGGTACEQLCPGSQRATFLSAPDFSPGAWRTISAGMPASSPYLASAIL